MTKQTKIPREIIEAITPEYAYHHKIVPVELRDGSLKIGHSSSHAEELVSDLEFITGKRIVLVSMLDEEVFDNIKALYGEKFLTANPQRSGEFAIIEKEIEEKNDKVDIPEELSEISVVSLVNKIITNAVDRCASDIHVEVYENQFRIRYRIDGVLQEVMSPPIEKEQAIISRLKIMADLDIAEKRRPQDGRIRVRREDKLIDIRVSTLPTNFGEKVVLRILDKSQLNLDLERLGFEREAFLLYKRVIDMPYGMVLVTGPTGSGKTTTLYATLNYINTDEINIITIEDPIEYNLVGINQSQVRSDIGFTFANALRAFLRQDPDVIMVGEIRDSETAEIAIRAALTGHLVFSTLHTNSAPDTLTRLVDMGQEPFLISSSTRMVVAQRLVRKICENCKVPDKNPSNLDYLTIPSNIDLSDVEFYRGEGCEKCNGSGYLGRTAIFEVMPISTAIADAINRRCTATELKDIACSEGMHTLQQSAIIKLKQGITTVEEVLRVTKF